MSYAGAVNVSPDHLTRVVDAIQIGVRRTGYVDGGIACGSLVVLETVSEAA